MNGYFRLIANAAPPRLGDDDESSLLAHPHFPGGALYSSVSAGRFDIRRDGYAFSRHGADTPRAFNSLQQDIVAQ